MSSRDSKIHSFEPSSFTRFHQRSPTSSRPLTFCHRKIKDERLQYGLRPGPNLTTGKLQLGQQQVLESTNEHLQQELRPVPNLTNGHQYSELRPVPNLTTGLLQPGWQLAAKMITG